MTMTPARPTLLTAAALLEQAAVIDRVSRPLTLFALAGAVMLPILVRTQALLFVGVAAAIAIAGLIEMYLAVRINFDAALFRQVANASDPPDFDPLDQSLTSLGLLPASKRGRDASLRIAGALQLMRLQAIALAVQVLSIIGAGVVLALAV